MSRVRPAVRLCPNHDVEKERQKTDYNIRLPNELPMNKTFSLIIPNPDDLLALEPEELAGAVMEYLHSQDPNGGPNMLNRLAFISIDTVKVYPKEYHEHTKKALMEAWVWLEREGFIAPLPGDSGSGMFITRKGLRVKGLSDLKSYQNANLFPKHLLHPVIVHQVYSAFLRGEYATAVFQAFKEVEVAVRKAGNYAQTDIGVPLMRKAFEKSSGALTRNSLPEAEKDAMPHLFAGAIGLYKNPHSHRNEPITDPKETVSLLVLASHLLYIVDARAL